MAFFSIKKLDFIFVLDEAFGLLLNKEKKHLFDLNIKKRFFFYCDEDKRPIFTTETYLPKFPGR